MSYPELILSTLAGLVGLVGSLALGAILVSAIALACAGLGTMLLLRLFAPIPASPVAQPERAFPSLPSFRSSGSCPKL